MQHEADATQLRCPDPSKLIRDLNDAGIATWSMDWQGIKLSVLRKPFIGQRPVLLLHGVTYSAASVFDLHVPGAPRDAYSTILQLAARGLDCWALDFAGYGLSESCDYGRPETPDDYVSQVAEVAANIRHLTGQAPILIGWSWGAQVASRAMAKAPDLFSGLVFWGGFWGGSGKLDDLPKRPLPTTTRRANTAEHASADFLTPDNYCADVRNAFVKHALWVDPSSPTSGITHSTLNLPLHEPAAVKCPTLVIHGTQDPVVNRLDIQDFVSRLGDKLVSYVRIPGADHNVQYSENRHLLFDALASFTGVRSVRSMPESVS